MLCMCADLDTGETNNGKEEEQEGVLLVSWSADCKDSYTDLMTQL